MFCFLDELLWDVNRTTDKDIEFDYWKILGSHQEISELPRQHFAHINYFYSISFSNKSLYDTQSSQA